MPSLSKTKHRISAIQGTRKTTKAMGLIATVKTKTLRTAFDKNNLFLEECLSLMGLLFAHDDDTKTHYAKLNDESLPTCYIVISSNMGLCGAYNTNLFKYADSLIKETDYILALGNKAANHYQRSGKYPNVIRDYSLSAMNINMDDLRNVCQRLKDDFNAKKFKNIVLIYTHYINTISSAPESFQLLPVSITPKKWKNEDWCPPIFDEPPRSIIHALLPDYLSSVIYGRLLESELSEQASRRTAMDNANDNADELLDKLNIEYNKARQNAITQEITEVVGGANAHD
ncbi:MAG: ATP synthase F1 subunit gamma [Bacilli bacterium]|nr:ATP synthase F1 subunit gamma [Bacilli bacterium]